MRTPSMLSFDCKSHVYFMLHKSLGDEQMAEQTQKLEDLLARLEEERVKIDAFKRELPMCMQLLTNAMEASRQQLHLQRSNEITTTPILEEFIPLKNDTLNENDQSAADKAGWMTSAQLPNQENEMEGPQSVPHHQETEIRLALGGKQKIDALLPFSDLNGHRRHHDEFLELALASSHKEAVAVEDGKTTTAAAATTTNDNNNNNNNNNSQAQRKVRRCWSPDLHRRFVNALHMLGGSQVATPKQIRELMKVDGLTNDEVKSHLQKYRLHTRRPSPSPQTAAPQVVVLGGIWVPPEYAAAAAANHHPAPMFFSPAPPQVGAQDMYPPIAPLPQPTASPSYQIHHLGGDVPQQQQQIHLNRAKSPSTKRNGSPESDIQGADDDPSESIEEGKSESAGSWKGDSDGENGGERISRVEGEESKASSIVSLKF